MIVRFLLAAIAAGLFAGFSMTAAQQLKVVPLIVQAETYESNGSHSHDETGTDAQDAAAATGHDDQAAETEAGGLLFGLPRFGGTLLANLVTGAGFGLLLAGVTLLSGLTVSMRSGLLFGAAGWLAVQLLPALGLPPELPGFPHTDLQARQIWWVATVLLSGAGLYLVLLRHEAWALAIGVLGLAAPHIYGAPRPDNLTSAVPAYLAAEYSVAALATTLFFWLVLGTAYGWLSGRIGERQ